MSLIFRGLEGRDNQYLAELFNFGFQEYYVDIQLTAEMVAQMIVRENLDLKLSYEAVLEDTVIGFIWTGVRDQLAWCGGIGLGPEYRGQGFGEQIMAYCIAKCREAGLLSYQLECIKENKRGVRLYKNIGLQVIGELLNFRHSNPEPCSYKHHYSITQGSEIDLINYWDILHEYQKSWQSDLPSLLYRSDSLQILILTNSVDVVGLMVYSVNDRGIHLYDLAVLEDKKELCQILIAELHQYGKPISAPLVLGQSMLVQVLREAGYEQYLDQVQMFMEL